MNFSRMKVLIQNSENALYLEGLDRWSRDINEALDFGNSDNAIRFCAAHKIAPVHVVLQWSGMPYSIAIPIAVTHQQPDGDKAGRLRRHA
jgi:hypothetical protein